MPKLRSQSQRMRSASGHQPLFSTSEACPISAPPAVRTYCRPSVVTTKTFPVLSGSAPHATNAGGPVSRPRSTLYRKKTPSPLLRRRASASFRPFRFGNSCGPSQIPNERLAGLIAESETAWEAFRNSPTRRSVRSLVARTARPRSLNSGTPVAKLVWNAETPNHLVAFLANKKGATSRWGSRRC